MSERLTISFTVALLALLVATPTAATEGFYKDVFVDGGCWLTGRQSLAAAEYLGLSQEALALPYEPTDEHERIQAEKIAGNDDDTNGCLLYPDGAPRFRLIQTNGGSATRHGRTLGEEGRQRIRDFYYGGGSYTGTCAGFFIATLAAFDDGVNENYYHIWPGRPRNTGLLDSRTGMFIEPGSPLLAYFDFGGDEYVDELYHNGGGYAEEDHPEWPAGTEILARFDYPGWSMDEQVSCLSYKEDDLSGRLVIIGSHPEGVASGERRDLMAAMMLYALDGQGDVRVKGELESGAWRTMDRFWEDQDPAHARIGDQQYHQFFVEVPAGAVELNVVLEGDEDYDLDLYLRQGDVAFASTADASSTSPTSSERIAVLSPDEGVWFVSVHCATSVTETAHDWYVEYTGDVGVLNGVAYDVMAEVTVASVLAVELPEVVTEDQGVAHGSVTASPAPATDLGIHLESSHPNRLAVPSGLLLPAGEERVDFQLDILDNTTFDGDVEVTLITCAAGYDCIQDRIAVTEDDDEPSEPSCVELGGVCCSGAQRCEDGVGQETSDCQGVCCVGGSCRYPDADPGEVAEPNGEDVGVGDGGAAESPVALQDGCTCRSSHLPFDPAGSVFWLLFVGLFVGRRRRRSFSGTQT